MRTISRALTSGVIAADPTHLCRLKLQLNDHEMARVGVNLHQLPGVAIEAQLTRHYPHGDLLSHVVGYVGRINESEASQIDEQSYRGYFAYWQGRSGKNATSLCFMGRSAIKILRRMRTVVFCEFLDEESPSDGADLQLHLDLDLQRAAYDALGDQRGAVVAIDPSNGGILALVSNPSFDGNLFVNGISSKDYSALRDSTGYAPT